MKLKDFTRKDEFFKTVDSFKIGSNRFYLFDSKGRLITTWSLASRYPNYLELEVLDSKETSYTNTTYFVGYSISQIKLDIDDVNILSVFKHEYGTPYVE